MIQWFITSAHETLHIVISLAVSMVAEKDTFSFFTLLDFKSDSCASYRIRDTHIGFARLKSDSRDSYRIRATHIRFATLISLVATVPDTVGAASSLATPFEFISGWGLGRMLESSIMSAEFEFEVDSKLVICAV